MRVKQTSCIPRLMTFSDFAQELDFDAKTLKSVRVSYRKFRIAKKNGGYREIEAPNEELKIVQERIYRKILKDMSYRLCVKGFVPRESIVSNAEHHVNKNFVINLDLKNFFHSVKRENLMNILRNL